MKKVTMGLILSLISISTFACHLDNRGICDDKAYFMAKNLYSNSIYEFRYVEDTSHVITVTTGNTFTDSLMAFTIVKGATDIKLQFRNKYLDGSNEYGDWGGNYNEPGIIEMIDSLNSACKLLPVSISNVGVQKNGNNINVSFKGGDETGVKEYEILASVNQTDWYNIKTLAATGKRNYMATISLTGSAAFILFGIALCNENKKKYSNKRKWVSFFLLAGMIVLFSCTKAKDTGTIQPYKFIKVATISNSGAAPSYSETTSIP